MLARILKDVEASKDAVQQAYYRLWENRSMLTITISPRAYLYRAVYNNCINSITRKDMIRKYEEESVERIVFFDHRTNPGSRVAVGTFGD